MMRFPPFGGSEATTRGGVAPKVQTTSAKNAENGLLWARWTAFWAKQCRTCASFAREPLNIRVSPLMRTSTPRHAPGRRCPRPYHRVNVRIIGPTCASKGPSHHLLGPGAQQVARTRISGPPGGARGAGGGQAATATNRSNFACNAPINLSHIEITSLQFQRFRAPQGTSSGELHATFGGCHP